MPSTQSEASHSPGGPASEVAGPETVPPAPFSPTRLAVLALTAGLIAGLASWLTGEATRTTFQPPLRPVTAMGVTIMQADVADEVAAEVKNAALAFGVLGAAVGAALGLAGGLSRANARSAAASGLLGLLLGGAAGGLATFLCAPHYYRSVGEDPLSSDLLLPFLVHLGIGAAIGAAAGLALGIGVGARRYAANGLIGGLFGAIVGVALYEFAGAFLFPLAKTPQPISAEWTTRLLAHLAIAAGVSAGAWLLVTQSGNRPAPARAD